MITQRVKCVLASLMLSCAVVPTVALSEDTSPVPACSLADINQALASDLTCSTDGTVFFGTDANQFIINQCSGLTNPGETGDALKQAQLACVKCAKRAAGAFQSAAKAGLIHPTKGINTSDARLKKLCNLSDGGDNGDKPRPPESDAIKSMYDQIRLCLPSEGHSTDKAQCTNCSDAVLDAALAASVITQQKYDVLKKSVEQICSKPRGGDGSGEEHPRPTPVASPGATPPPTGKLDGYLSAVRSCFAQFHNPQNNQPATCMSCVQALPTDGLDPAKATYVLSSASRICNGSFGGGDHQEPPPSPTPH